MPDTPHSTINNCESVLKKISNLYCDRLLSDVTLQVGLREYPAHRLILCASSDVFQVMLLKPEWSESCERVVVLHEAEECEQQFGTFLQYLYTGQVVLTHASVLPILALADKYNVEDLRVVCGLYMKQHMVSAAEHNLLLSWLQYCMASQHTAVATACLNHFKWNFEQVAKTSDFLNCDVGLLISVLAQHDLVVPDEMTLYSYVVQWLEQQECRLMAASESSSYSRSVSPSPQPCSGQPPLLQLHPKIKFQLKEEIADEESHSSIFASTSDAPTNTCFHSMASKSGMSEAFNVPRPVFTDPPDELGCARGCHGNRARLNPRASPASSSVGCEVQCSNALPRSGLALQNVFPFNVPLCAFQQCPNAQPRRWCSNTIVSHASQTCSVQAYCSPSYLCHHCHSCPNSSNRFLHNNYTCCGTWPRSHCSSFHGHNFPPILPSPNNSNPMGASGSSSTSSYFMPMFESSGNASVSKKTGSVSNSLHVPAPLQLDTGKLYLRCLSASEDGERPSNCSDVAQKMECLTYEVMSYVRFPMMTPRQLADLLLVPLTIQYKEFFVTRMAVGMAFHSGQWSRVQEVMESRDESSRLMFTPRLYTAEQWSAGLTVDNLPALPSFNSRTLFFSTPASASELQNDTQLEWIVELYPKGVWFRKYLLIVWQGTVEVPEVILRTVRLSVTHNATTAAAAPDKNPALAAASPRVRLAVLVSAYRDGVEFVSHVVTKRHIFSPDDCHLNMDDILPFDSLNDPKEAAQYLLPPCDSLKLHVVISPLSAPAFSPSAFS
ncbi:BTB/POZ domain [Trinorchestia longiramus]|nr:BTB/POZ domain [Trinorchestia longiramus]